MKRFSFVAVTLVASLGACSYKETVQQPAPAPSGTIVATTPAPAGSAVVYSQPAPATTTVYTTR